VPIVSRILRSAGIAAAFLANFFVLFKSQFLIQFLRLHYWLFILLSVYRVGVAHLRNTTILHFHTSRIIFQLKEGTLYVPCKIIELTGFFKLFMQIKRSFIQYLIFGVGISKAVFAL